MLASCAHVSLSLSDGLCAPFRQSIPKVLFGWLARAIFLCSHCPHLMSSCLHNCSPCSLMSQDCHCVFVEVPCEPKLAGTKSTAGLVLPMSVISVVSIWRDDVYFVFPTQIPVAARSRMCGAVWSRRLSCLANCTHVPAFSSWTMLFPLYWCHPLVSMSQPGCYEPEGRARNNRMERKRTSDSCGPQVLTPFWE